jgi:hypothetical protein
MAFKCLSRHMGLVWEKMTKREMERKTQGRLIGSRLFFKRYDLGVFFSISGFLGTTNMRLTNAYVTCRFVIFITL